MKPCLNASNAKNSDAVNVAYIFKKILGFDFALQDGALGQEFGQAKDSTYTIWTRAFPLIIVVFEIDAVLTLRLIIPVFVVLRHKGINECIRLDKFIVSVFKII